MPCVPSLCFTFYHLLYHPPPVDAPFVEWFPLPWPSLEFVPAVPGALGASLGMGRENLSLQSRTGAFVALPAAGDLCLEALCECQGKLGFVLASSSHSLGCSGVCPAQGCAWALLREIFQVHWFLHTVELCF